MKGKLVKSSKSGELAVLGYNKWPNSTHGNLERKWDFGENKELFRLS